LRVSLGKLSAAEWNVFLVAISCKRVNEDATPMWNPSKSEIAKWKEDALTKGDTNAYYNLSLDYMDSPYEGFFRRRINNG